MTDNLEKAQFHIAKAIEQLNGIENLDVDEILGAL